MAVALQYGLHKAVIQQNGFKKLMKERKSEGNNNYSKYIFSVFDCFQRDKSPEKPERSAPEIHLHGNPSSFAIYASIRQTVLEDQIKQISQIYLQACQTMSTESDSDDDGPDKSHESQMRLPKVWWWKIPFLSQKFNGFCT